MLKTDGILLSLDLSNNDISDDGAIVLAQSLQENSVLEGLSLAFNKYSFFKKEQ